MHLTDEQEQAVSRGEEVSILIEATECVVIRKDLYRQLQQLARDLAEWTAEDRRALLTRALESSDWNDPEMDAYDHYDEQK